MSARRLTLGPTWCLTLLALACVGAEHGTSPRSAAATPAPDSLDDGPPHALLKCLTGDSAVYSAMRGDGATGDTAGVWLTFYRLRGGVDGIRVLGAPDRADTTPFLRVDLMDDDSVAFDVPTAPTDAYRDGIDTSRFLGRVSCDRLWGRQREHRDRPSQAVIYHRLYARPDTGGDR